MNAEKREKEGHAKPEMSLRELLTLLPSRAESYSPLEDLISEEGKPPSTKEDAAK